MGDKTQQDYSVIIPLLHGNGDVVINSKDEQCTNIGNASFISTCFNCLNALSGIGIVSLPYAMASGGWLSLILLFVIAGLTFYTGLLIQRCMDTDPTITSYPDIGNHAFGKTGKAIVSITMNIEVYFLATGFLILEDNMNILSYVSASGVLASMVIIGWVFWVGAADGIGFHEKGKLMNQNGIPTAISLYTLCFCGHTVFPTLYTSMKNRRQYSKVLLLSFALCAVTYSLMAVIGYLMFGSMVESQITLNLPTDKISSRVAICTILITPVAKYALQITPILNAIEAHFQASYYRRERSFIIRTILMISTVIVALSFPFFVYLMSLVGALLCATTSITIPCFCYLKISGIYKRIGVELVIVVFVLLSGLIVAVVGTYVSLGDIINHL